MTNLEFSLEFNTLFNNINSGYAPGINEYEKSVFLTKAQEEIMKNYLNPLGNKYQEGFDGSLKRDVDFATLVTTSRIAVRNTTLASIDKRAIHFNLPTDLFVILNEVYEAGSKSYQVVPVSFSEYTQLMSKPYKEPLKDQAWKLTTNGSSTLVTTVIPNSNASNGSLTVRYIRRPKPIVLTDLSSVEEELGLPTNTLSINGVKTSSPCEMPEELHREILDRAIEIAKVAYAADQAQAILQINSRNE